MNFEAPPLAGIVGAPSKRGVADFSGAAYLYNVNTGNEILKLTPSDAANRDRFGESVAIDDSTAIVGAPGPFNAMGAAYLLIANLYASSANNCGNSQFEKRAVYWLAAKEARKAANVDASIKKIATRTAESYEGRAPTKTDIFTEGNAGQVIRFSCWIGQSVTVPSL